LSLFLCCQKNSNVCTYLFEQSGINQPEEKALKRTGIDQFDKTPTDALNESRLLSNNQVVMI